MKRQKQPQQILQYIQQQQQDQQLFSIHEQKKINQKNNKYDIIKVKTKLIKQQQYPFNIQQQHNIMHMTYTVFANKSLLKKLGITIQSYQILKQVNIKQQQSIVLIIPLSNQNYSKILLQSSIKQQHQDILYLSNHLYQYFKHPQQLQISPLNKILSLITIQSYVFPKLKILKELYIHIDNSSTNISYQSLLINLVSQYPFIFIGNNSNKKLDKGNHKQYFINISHILFDRIISILSNNNNSLNNNNNILSTIKRKQQQNKQTNITNLLKIKLSTKIQYNKNNQSQYYVFKPGVTKLIMIKSIQTSSIFQISLHIPQIYQKAFIMEPYQNLFKYFCSLIDINQKESQSSLSFSRNKLIGIHCQRGNGMLSFLYRLALKINHYFTIIDCYDYPTPKEIYNKVKNIHTGQNNLIYIKNTQWLKIISHASNNNSGSSSGFDPYKNSLRIIEQSFYQGVRKSMNKNILVIQSQNIIDDQLFQNAQILSFILSKQQKLKLIQKVLQIQLSQELYDNIQKDSLVIKTALSIGWARFYKILQVYKDKYRKINSFLKQSKQNNISKFIQGLVLEIHKQTKIQKVENIANITWDDIGGLEAAKQEIIQTIMLPTKHPQIFDEKIPPRTGLLFYGPPGTGKTMLGKCIANQCKMGFISVKGPELLNMYIGESQKNLRRLFQRAYKSRPCIVFMDQLDALIPKKGNSGDSNQVMDRIVSQLLMQMDIAGANGIFIIGATNRPDLLDPSILVPGRFDKQVYLGISKNKKDQLKILQAQTRNLKLNQGLDLNKVLDILPQNLTGADFYGLTSKAIMNSMQRVVNDYQKRLEQCQQTGQIVSINDIIVVIRQQDFMKAAQTVVPSVSQQELKHYESLKTKYS